MPHAQRGRRAQAEEAPALNFEPITSIEQVHALVADAVHEDSFLEFKSGALLDKSSEDAIVKLSCGITAFANGGGGQIVIGVEENRTAGLASRAAALRPISDPTKSAEWVSKKLESRIVPRIPGLRIEQLQAQEGGHALVLWTDQSEVGPHQAADQKYYARRQFQKLPMQHYEIEDVRNRARVRVPEVRVGIEYIKHTYVELFVENRGDEAVTSVHFHFPDDIIPFLRKNESSLWNGVTALNPGERIPYNIGGMFELFEHDALKRDNPITVEYIDSRGRTHHREIILNLANHEHAGFNDTGIDHLREQVVKELRLIGETLIKNGEALRTNLEPLTAWSGLALSEQAVGDLAFAFHKLDERVPRNPLYLNALGLQEVLGCSLDDAHRLESFLTRERRRGMRIEDMGDLSLELIAKARARLRIPGEEF